MRRSPGPQLKFRVIGNCKATGDRNTPMSYSHFQSALHMYQQRILQAHIADLSGFLEIGPTTHSYVLDLMGWTVPSTSGSMESKWDILRAVEILPSSTSPVFGEGMKRMRYGYVYINGA